MYCNCSFCDKQRIYEKLSSLSKHSPFTYFPTIQAQIFVERSSFLRLEAIFLRLEISRGTTIVAVICQTVEDLNLEAK